MSGEFAAAEAFFPPLQPMCHKVIPCRGCKSFNIIISHANKYNSVSSWMEDRLWKSLRLRLEVLWQIFFKCFLLFKLETLPIKQLRSELLSSWGAAPGFTSQMVDIRTWLYLPESFTRALDFLIPSPHPSCIEAVCYVPIKYLCGLSIGFSWGWLSWEGAFPRAGVLLFVVQHPLPIHFCSWSSLKKDRKKRHTG